MKIKPYYPLPYKPGNKVIRKYIETFNDGAGNKALITKVDYTDKKGRTIVGFTLFVRWV
ncbi:MAG: hypothetical protein KAS32_23835 [Candidatus Peribacteraceae bacterium]|nr:hypothetical protein [Candidatus Peribacteraceae bacterium]